MCSIGLLLTGVGGAVQAAGQIAAGRQQQALYEAQADAQRRQAESVQRAAGFEISKEQRRQAAEQAAARAQIGRSGVGFEGSPTSVLTDNAGTDQLDLEVIGWNARNRVSDLNTQAGISEFQGEQARQASLFQAAGTVIGTASGMFEGFADPTTGQVPAATIYDPSRAVRMGGVSPLFRRRDPWAGKRMVAA